MGAQDGTINLLIGLLESEAASDREEAACAIGELAQTWNNKGLAVELGAVPSLLRCLQRGSDRECELACFALGALAANHKANKCIIAQAGAIERIAPLLQ